MNRDELEGEIHAVKGRGKQAAGKLGGVKMTAIKIVIGGILFLVPGTRTTQVRCRSMIG